MMPTSAPTVAQILADPGVQTALEQAWADSLPDDPASRHEEGGWLYVDMVTGRLTMQRAKAGDQHELNLRNPPIVQGSFVVATFHTHPNPTSEGWAGGPSTHDELSADFLGVPCIIRADDGNHVAGPISRRGGLSGKPGFPD